MAKKCYVVVTTISDRDGETNFVVGVFPTKKDAMNVAWQEFLKEQTIDIDDKYTEKMAKNDFFVKEIDPIPAGWAEGYAGEEVSVIVYQSKSYL